MPASYLGRRRSRPVADAPALDGAEVAKAWLVELVAVAPLERAARLPGPRFAEDAPRLCAAVVAALGSDAALDDLEPGGALAPLAAGAGHLAAAPTALEAVSALDALRAVVWSAIVEAADRPVPGQVADLADRLGAVVSALTTATLESPHPLGPSRPGDRGPLAAVLREARPGEAGDAPQAVIDFPVERAGVALDFGADADHGDDAEPDVALGGWPPPQGGAPEAERSRVDIPRAEAPRPDPPRPETPRPEAARPEGPRVEDAAHDGHTRRRRRSTPAPPEGSPRRPSAGDALAQIEATLRDAASAADPLAEAAARLRALEHTADLDDGPDPFSAAATRLRSAVAPLDEPRIRRLPEVEDATDFTGARVTPWGASIERRLARHRGDGLPFAVLCVELVDADRLVHAGMDREVVEALEAAEAAVLGQLRPADALIRERPGRYWLTTPDTDASDARALGHRIAAAVEALPPHRGAPLLVAVGATTCPADAADANELEQRAEEALFAARATGVRVAGPPGT
jgi:GGDEF domain-containing protein